MKRCFKCGTRKPLSEFYKHSMMADGHLNKCKECTKRDVRANRADNLEHYRAYDRERSQLPERVEASRAHHLDWKARNPEKRKAHVIVSNAIRDGRIERRPCERCGKKAHAHHDDYSKPLDVVWLCPVHHVARHKELSQSA